MNTQSLQYILTIAEEKSYSRAAERWLLSQPSLSYHVAELEKETGVKIFSWNGREVLPTPEGRKILAGIDRILAEEKALAAELSELLGRKVELG